MIIVSWGLEGRGKLQKRRKKVHQEKGIMSKGAEVKNKLARVYPESKKQTGMLGN